LWLAHASGEEIRKQQTEEQSMATDTMIRTIITDPDGAETLVRRARQLGEELAKPLTTSQIRALFGEVRQIQAQWSMGDPHRALARRRLTLLKPKMAYRARKESGQGVARLVNELDAALDLVLDQKNEERQTQCFQQFVEYFEAILAYHRAYGGK
jgi:CRISPR-associated protein Csm2